LGSTFKSLKSKVNNCFLDKKNRKKYGRYNVVAELIESEILIITGGNKMGKHVNNVRFTKGPHKNRCLHMQPPGLLTNLASLAF